MIQYLVVPPRVLRVEIVPGPKVKGCCRHTLTLSVESGPPLEFSGQDELDRFTAALVADLVGDGIDVVGWAVILDEG